MKYSFLKYYLVFILFFPSILFAQTHIKKDKSADTLKLNSYNDSLFINNHLKSDQFYDTLINRASKNNITKAALNLLLVSEPNKGKFIGVEDIRNEEYFNLYKGKTIRNIDVLKLDVFGPSLTDTSKQSNRWIDQLGKNTHIKTRDFIIRNNLFFDVGDTIDPVILTDNERLLRSLNYITNASIQIAEIPDLPDQVDVLVVSKDVYSAGFY